MLSKGEGESTLTSRTTWASADAGESCLVGDQDAVGSSCSDLSGEFDSCALVSTEVEEYVHVAFAEVHKVSRVAS
jgi:hypothetical protein